jgi:hypothetical protein
MIPPKAYIGRGVRKAFSDYGVFEGTVTATRYDRGVGRLWRVVYSDGDNEELAFAQLRGLMGAFAAHFGGKKQHGTAASAPAAALHAGGAGGAPAAQGAAAASLLQARQRFLRKDTDKSAVLPHEQSPCRERRPRGGRVPAGGGTAACPGTQPPAGGARAPSTRCAARSSSSASFPQIRLRRRRARTTRL